MKRYFSLLLCLMALLTLVTLPVHAEDEGVKVSGGYQYSVNEDGTATILGSDLVYGNVVIPSSLDGYTVTAIGDNAFYNTDSITSVIIPGTVKTVGEYSFGNCQFLKSVTLCEGIVTLGRSCFGLCPLLESVHIPLSVSEVTVSRYMGNGPFRLSGLHHVTFAPGRTEIPIWLFEGTSSLKSITIPDTVTTISEGAFYQSGLESVFFSSAGNLTTIENLAFFNCSLETLALPEGLTFIGNDAFSTIPTLKEISFPSTLHTIDSCAFLSCTALTEVRLNEGLHAIGYRAFSGCTSLATAHIPASLTECITTKYGSSGPFMDSGLTTVTFGKGTTRVVEHLFEETPHLGPITLPDTVTGIGERAFRKSGLTGIWLGSGLQTIGAYAFAECADLVTPLFPEGLVTIGSAAFHSCTSFGDPRFPASLRTIGEEAFKNCDGIEKVFLNHGLEVIGRSAFAECDHLYQTYIPASLQRVITWGYGNNGPFTNSSLRSILFQEGVTAIPDHLFDSCPKLKGLRLPDTITVIGESAFFNCTALADISMPRNLERIEIFAFQNCTSLTRMALGEKFSFFDAAAFDGCENLTALFFNGPAPQITLRANFPEEAVLYYLEGQEGWTTPYYPDPDQERYPTAPIMGEPDLMDEKYLDKLAQHHFLFVDWTNGPIDQVAVSFDGFTYSSGEASELDCMIAAEDGTVITFTREGYHPLTLPLEVLRGISTIRLFPETWATPYVEGCYARDESGTVYDLANDGMTLLSMDSVKLDFYIQFNPMLADSTGVLMSFSSSAGEKLIALKSGWNARVAIDPVYVKNREPYLELLQNDRSVYRQVLRVNVEIPPEEIKIATGTPLQLFSDWLDNLFQPGSAQMGMNLFDGLKVSYKSIGKDQFEVFVGINPGGAISTDLSPSLDNEFEKAMDNMDQGTDSLADLLSDLDKVYEITPDANATSRIIIDCQGLLVGYGTGRFVTDEKTGEVTMQLEKISFGLDVTGLVKGRKQFQLGTKPVYVSSEINSKNSILANAEWLGMEEGIRPTQSVFSGTTSVIARAGFGWDQFIAGGAKGSINLEYNCPLPLDEHAFSVFANGTIGLDATLLFLEYDVELIRTENLNLKRGSLPLDALSTLSPKSFDWKPQSRDYLVSSAPAGTFTVQSSGTASSAAGESILAGVYPHTAVQLAQLSDGRLLAVWVADDGTKADTNRSTLYYMVCDDAGWSAPAPVAEDGTADFLPVLRTENGSVWLLWQDADQPLTSNDLTESLSRISLCCARFDGTSFEVLGDFGTEGCYDGAMSLTTVEGQPAVVYTSDASNDILSEARTVDLHRAVWNGETWVDEILLKQLTNVDQTASEGTTVWFTADSLRSRELFRYDGALTQLTEDDLADSNLSVENGNLIWFRDGMLTDGTQQMGTGSANARYQYLHSGNQEVLLWAATDAHSYSTLYARFRDGDTWGDPVKVDGGNGYISSFHGQLLEDGTLTVLVSERGVILPDAEYALSELTAAAELRLYRADFSGGLRLDDADYISSTLIPGKPLVLRLDLTNTGARTLTAVEVSILDGNSLLSTEVYAVRLLSGQSEVLLAALPLGTEISEQLTVTVTPVGLPEGDPSDNTKTVSLNLTDLSLEEAVAISGEDSVTVTVLAANRCFAEIEEAILQLTDEEGNILATETIRNLQPGDGTYVTFRTDTLPKKEAHLSVVAEVLDGEALTSNNRIGVTVTASVSGPVGMLAAPQITSDGEGSDTVTVTVTLSANATTTVLAASYDETGRFLGVVTKTVDAGTGTVVLEDVAAGHSYRLFLTDSSYAPLCQAEPLD